MVFIALTFGVLIFLYQKLYGYRLGLRWKIINFDQVFDAFTFGVSTFCVWISIGILMKKHRFWHRFCCFYLRRVDFFVSRTTSTSCMSEPHHEVPKILKNWRKRPKSTQILILFFGASGTGKIVRDDFWSKTNAFSYFIFFSEPQNDVPTCIVQKYQNKIDISV